MLGTAFFLFQKGAFQKAKNVKIFMKGNSYCPLF